ncbi:unnamed protein product [Urochloa decumbens]|uniref:Uncharacterized protein n=1 Tax=Urochloa decumbens TaxID=240449 RepID=A0ABC9EYX1_9POAL
MPKLTDQLTVDEYWDHYQNKMVLKDVPDICESSATKKDKCDKGVVVVKKMKKEVARPTEKPTRFQIEHDKFMSDIVYEGLCLVEGELPDKLARNGSTEGEISTVSLILSLNSLGKRIRRLYIDCDQNVSNCCRLWRRQSMRLTVKL